MPACLYAGQHMRNIDKLRFRAAVNIDMASIASGASGMAKKRWATLLVTHGGIGVAYCSVL